MNTFTENLYLRDCFMNPLTHDIMTLYDIAIRAYGLAIRLASPFNKKAALWVKGRRSIWKRLAAVERRNGRLVWFHAASLGEFEQGRPVMERLREIEPHTRILLTFFSPSGYEIRKNYTGADHICYLPLDTAANARRLLDIFHPDAAVFVKYEFWYHYLRELHARQIPTYLISAIFRPSQPFFKRWGGFHRKMLGFFTRLYVQDETSLRLLAGIGIDRVQQAGDTRFDRVAQIAKAARDIPPVEKFCQGRPAVVCGSTWPADEDIITAYVNAHPDTRKWIIVPHEIGENHIREILSKCRVPAVRYTDPQANLPAARVLVIDRIGFLSSVYRYGDIAYVGGGFGKGIHNTLEAAVYGIPVIFGPRHEKFKEALDLLHCGGAFTIKNKEEFSSLVDSLLENPTIAHTAGQNALAYVHHQLGATEAIIRQLVD